MFLVPCTFCAACFSSVVVCDRCCASQRRFGQVSCANLLGIHRGWPRCASLTSSDVFKKASSTIPKNCFSIQILLPAGSILEERNPERGPWLHFYRILLRNKSSNERLGTIDRFKKLHIAAPIGSARCSQNHDLERASVGTHFPTTEQTGRMRSSQH